MCQVSKPQVMSQTGCNGPEAYPAQNLDFFSAEKFYSVGIHYHNTVWWHVENVGNTLKKSHLIM